MNPVVWHHVKALQKDAIYTIREVVLRTVQAKATWAVYLVEIHNNLDDQTGFEFGYDADRFAPLLPTEHEEEEETVLVPTHGKRELAYTTD
jgi:hypothetical protein